MSENVQKRAARDRGRIKLEQDYEVRYWTRQLHCSEDELRAAIQRVGDRPASVERLLHQSRKLTYDHRPLRWSGDVTPRRVLSKIEE